MNACANYACTLYGCQGYCRGYTMTRYYNTVPYQWAQWPVQQPGCICPPTSEQTCQAATCPRKAPAKETAT